MSRICYFLGQLDLQDSLVAGLHKTSPSRNGLTLLFGTVAVVILLIVGWAIFIRKRPDEGSRRYRYPSRDSKSKDGNNLKQSAAESGGRKRRHRKRRPRNPTLAETGGLPPLRSEGSFEDPP